MTTYVFSLHQQIWFGAWHQILWADVYRVTELCCARGLVQQCPGMLGTVVMLCARATDCTPQYCLWFERLIIRKL